MKVLTLHQPWATLIALGVKTIETRSWRAPEWLIGQRFAIHAAAKVPDLGLAVGWYLVCDPEGLGMRRRVLALMHQAPSSSWIPPSHLPLGCIVATAVLDDCVPMVDGDHVGIYAQAARLGVRSDGALWLTRQRPDGEWWYYPVHDQLPYGDFRPGRWAWLLSGVEPVTEKCPACCGRTWTTPFGEDERCGKPAGHQGQHYAHWWASGSDVGCCPTCNGAGRCDPIPFKGGQGLSREWTP